MAALEPGRNWSQLSRTDGIGRMTVKQNSPRSAGTARRRRFLFPLPLLALIGLCGYFAWTHQTRQAPSAVAISPIPFAGERVGDFNVKFYGEGQHLQIGPNELRIEFSTQGGELIDVGDVTFEMQQRTADSVMHTISKVRRPDKIGRYQATAQPQASGTWTVTVGYSGAHGKASTNFSEVIP